MTIRLAPMLAATRSTMLSSHKVVERVLYIREAELKARILHRSFAAVNKFQLQKDAAQTCAENSSNALDGRSTTSAGGLPEFQMRCVTCTRAGRTRWPSSTTFAPSPNSVCSAKSGTGSHDGRPITEPARCN